MKKILILSPLSDQALAVARYLLKYGNGYVLHGGFMPGEAMTKHSYYEKVLCVKDKSAVSGYDIVLPTGAKSTRWMAEQFGEFRVNDISYCKENLLCFDKPRIISLVKDLGVPVPKTFENIGAIDIPLPVFYKQKFEEGGGPRGLAFSFAQLEQLESTERLIYQEYIPGGITYGMGFIAKSGDIITSFQHEELLSYPIQGGSAVYIRTFWDERIREYTERIIKALQFSGWGLAEYKYCLKRQDYVFMEINAKLWASIEFAFMNNSDFMRHLFGIDYIANNVKSAIFINRFIALGWRQMVRYVPQLLNASKYIYYHNTGSLIRSFISITIPHKLKRLLKNVLLQRRGLNKA